MSDKLFFSIIVPVYNAGKYLETCISSLVHNYIKDRVEILLVDDGSDDGSQDICDRYSEKFSFITTYHQTNKGAASARNFGLNKAAGKYVLFVDADDYIQDGVLEQILFTVQKSHNDVYLLKAYKVFENGRKEKLNQWENLLKLETKEQWMDWFSRLKKYPGSPCDKLFRLEFLTHNHIGFEEERSAEDLYFVLQSLVLAESYGVLENDYYYYRQNVKGSVTNRKAVFQIKDVAYAVSCGVALAEDFPEYKMQIYSMMAYEVEVTLYLYGCLEKKERLQIKNLVAGQKWLLGYRHSKRANVIKILLKIFGIDGCSKILKIGRSIKVR